MRKLIALILASAFVFTAGTAMATDYYIKDNTFSEEHSPRGHHYKATDIVIYGKHGSQIASREVEYQLDSATLKAVANDPLMAHTSFGFLTGKDPFAPGWAGGGSLGDTDWAMPAPGYTIPCPEWVTSNMKGHTTGDNGEAGMEGDCEANFNTMDPQTEDAEGIWDGVILDDLYQVVGEFDGEFSTFGEYSDSGNFEGTWAEAKIRFLDQTLDALFYNGKRGTIYKPGTWNSNQIIALTANSTWSGRHLNIDQTLDQDIADYMVEYEGTKVNQNNLFEVSANRPAIHEVMGIYGKLTQLFQMGGVELTTGRAIAVVAEHFGIDATSVKAVYPGDPLNNDTEANYDEDAEGNDEGCGSWGGGNPDGIEHGYKHGDCYIFVDLNNDNDYLDAGEEVLDGMGWNELLEEDKIGNFWAHQIDQWVVSDVYDWHPDPSHAGLDGYADKYRGYGVMQKYSQWFRDGSDKDYNFAYDYPAGHGTIDKDVIAPNQKIDSYYHDDIDNTSKWKDAGVKDSGN